MKTFNEQELKEILAKHRAWRFGEAGGECANLRGANLRGAYLDGAYLDGAYLRGAYLDGAYLRGADLGGAYLDGANLRGAYLDGAYLRGAYLDGAYLDGANLRGAYLDGAYLRGAYLDGAYLDGVKSFNGASGNCAELKAVQCDIWPVTYTHDAMQIGCQLHTLAEWWAFSDDEIGRMGSRALAWWKVWKPILKQIVEVSPATPHAGTKPE